MFSTILEKMHNTSLYLKLKYFSSSFTHGHALLMVLFLMNKKKKSFKEKITH